MSQYLGLLSCILPLWSEYIPLCFIPCDIRGLDTVGRFATIFFIRKMTFVTSCLFSCEQSPLLKRSLF